MSKIIKLKDEVYLLLKQQADEAGRTLAGHVEQLLKGTVKDEWADAVEARGEFKSQSLPCCLSRTNRCKHWQWDSTTGEGYVNVLTGETAAI